MALPLTSCMTLGQFTNPNPLGALFSCAIKMQIHPTIVIRSILDHLCNVTGFNLNVTSYIHNFYDYKLFWIL